MVVVQLRTAHSHIRRPGTWSPSNASSVRDTRGRSAGPRHVASMLRLYCFPVVDLGHPSHSPTPQTRVLIAVPPAVNRALDQATLAAQAWVQLSERPADRVALSLVVQTISLILILVAAGARIDTVLGLELLRKLVDVDRLDIATDRVLHLYTISRVLECNPLHTVLILPHDKWGSGWDRTGRGIRVHARVVAGGRVHTTSATRGSSRSPLRRTQSRRRSLQRSLVELRPGTARQSRSVRVRRRVLHLLRLLVGHQRHVGLKGCRVLLRRVRRLLRHLVWRIIHILRYLRGGLSVERPSMLIMLWRLDRRR